MKYKRIAIFTKTKWAEPPRIRHQLTNLLLSYEHKIIFFEKSSLMQFKITKETQNGIVFIKHFELLHHQLRPFKFLVKLNAFVTKYLIKKAIKDEKIDLVINFNYDYYFLKEIFGEQKIVTIINDDFVAQARPWMKKSIEQQLKNTCQNSDILFSVSFPLDKQLKEFNKDAKLFFPWAEQRYNKLKYNEERDVVLYWGYIDQRIDWNVIKYLLEENVKLRFIGIISPKINSLISTFKKYSNFEIQSAKVLSEINLDDVCYSILPYKITNKSNQSVTVSNRTFQLLSYGIPLVYSDLPYLIEAPNCVILKSSKLNDYLDAIIYFQQNWELSQNSIEFFLKNHYKENRYKLLKEFLEEK